VLLTSGAIVALYAATRFAFSSRFPYFIDEGTYAQYTWDASHSIHKLYISIRYGREPLQTWLAIPLVKLGIGPLNALRIVSVLAGLVTAAVVGLLGRRLGGVRVGLTAAALCVVLPFFVVHDGIGTAEPLVTLWMACALYLQVELARRPALGVAALLGLVLAAGYLTKDNTKPALALLPLSLLVFDWSPAGRRERLRTWLMGVGVVVLMLIAAQLVMRASSFYPLYQASRSGNFYLVRSFGDVLGDPFAAWGTAWAQYRPALVQYVSLPLLAVGALGAVLSWRRQPRLTLLLLAWLALPLLTSLTFAVLPFPRHIMYLLPAGVALIAYGLVEGVDWLRRRVSPRFAILVCALAVLIVLLPALRMDARVLANPDSARYPAADDHMVTHASGGYPWPAVADEIRRRVRAGKLVILSSSANPTIVNFLLGPDPRYTFVRGSSPLAKEADLALADETPFADVAALGIMQKGHFRVVRRFARPRGGAVVTMYARPGAPR
jgi:4-amino-4-deoxy-L-arabinose transferase-like glycosyltransferase